MGMGALKIGGNNTIIADERECLNNNLSVIARVGKGFEITCHSSSKNKFPYDAARSTK